MEDTRKQVAREFLEGKYQDDANVETIKLWVEQYFPDGLPKEDSVELPKKKPGRPKKK